MDLTGAHCSSTRIFSRNWTQFGDKVSLGSVITIITGIDQATLEGQDIYRFSIAMRIFWASQRGTTKAQDLAYCLLGIFAVNMPLVYGEGNQAFTRLQEEITKTSDDHSIFAWEINALMMTMHCSRATVQSCAAQWSDRTQSSLTLETSCLIGNNKQAIPTQ
jgi:hypothetical protein